MTNDCICSNVPRIWRLAGVTRTVRLTVTKDGSPYDFTGLQTVLRIDRDNSDFHYEPQFTVEGDDNNIIVFTWAADKQPLGDYTIEVTVTDGSGNKDRVNWHGATGVRLVEYSNLVKGEDAAGVESDSELGLDGIFTMNGVGMDAYEEWLADGNEGSLHDYILWMQGPAREAAEVAEAQMAVIQSRADDDHTTAGSDHTRAAADHTTATGDHTRAEEDHTRAISDHTRAAQDHTSAVGDHMTAGQDHLRAEADHTTAGSDHTRAESDHATAASDHSTAASDHTKAGQDSTRAGSDHDIAVADHAQAEADHTRAESDHTTAAADHTTAASDHTTASSDHTTAAADHTQAVADHAVMAGYDTRLGNVEDEVSQLGQEVDELEVENYQDNDFSISDENGVNIVSFRNGGIKTKKFDSENVNVIFEDSGGDSFDFAICDQDKARLVQFAGGHIQTKNFNSEKLVERIQLNNDEICDYYSIKNDGTHILDDNFGCTRYIDCAGCKTIKIKLPITESQSGRGIAFYNVAKTFIADSFTECSVGSVGAEIKEIQVPGDAYYFRSTYWNYANSLIYGGFSCEIKYPQGFLGERKYRPYQSGSIFFSVEVDQSVDNWQSTDATVSRTHDIKKTTGVLLLPTSYREKGAKTPIIMYCHGLSHGVYYGTWGSTANFQTQKQHFIERGYAVFDCNGAKDTNRQANGANCFLSSSPNVSAYYRTYKYIVENYNVEDKIYVIGGSMGGLVSTQFCLTFGNIVRAFALLAGYTSLYSWWSAPNPSGADVYPAYFGITGDDKTYATNIEKLKGYAPELRMFSIDGTTYYNGMDCPVHAWLGSEDASINMRPQLADFIGALRNSGKTAFIREPQGLGHEIVSGAILSIDNEVCDWFDSYK